MVRTSQLLDTRHKEAAVGVCICESERAQSQQKHLCLPAATEANTVSAAHMYTHLTSADCVYINEIVCASSLYLYGQKSFVIWEDSVCVDVLLKPA